MKLGKREVDAATCPPGKRDVLIFDDDLTGFGLRVTAAGAKVFLFQYRRGGRVRRMTLGRFGDVTPAQARRLAEVARGEVAAGRDPVAMKADVVAAEAEQRAEHKRLAAADAFTMGKLVDLWASKGLAGASANHAHQAPAALRRYFARFLDRPADSLRAFEVQPVVDALARQHPTTAKRARDYGRAMFNWGIGRELVTQNAFAAVRIEARVASRDRVLEDAELGAVWRATGIMPYPFGPLLRLLILTLQRRTEVAGMRWGELDPDLTTWTLPAARAKNRRAHIVHLAEPARAILRELAQRPRMVGQTLVFTMTGKNPPSGFGRANETVRRLMKLAAPAGTAASEPWTLHDFRRTGVTTLARLGTPPHVADRLLNHVGGTISGVAAIYQRHDFMAEREAALRLWADHVVAVAVAGEKDSTALPANVVRMPRRRGRS